MNKFLSNIMIEYLLKNNSINEDDRDVYEYCIISFLESFTYIIATFVLGVLIGKIFETIIFLICFLSLRKYAGGFHMKTSAGCMIISTSVYLVNMFGYEMLNKLSSYISLSAIMIIAALLIVICSPVLTKNRVLSDAEKKKCKLLSLIYTSVMIALSILLFEGRYVALMLCILISVLVSQLIGSNSLAINRMKVKS